MKDYKIKRGDHIDPDYVLDGRMFKFAQALQQLWLTRAYNEGVGTDYLRQLPEFDSVQPVLEPEMTDFAAALDAFERPSYVEGASYLFFIDNDPRFVLDDHGAADRTIDALKQDGVTVRAIAVMNNPTEDQLVAAGIGRAQ
jgi:hypothetical protein